MRGTTDVPDQRVSHRPEAVGDAGVEPDATVDAIARVPALLTGAD
ncbi:MAG TPA: hypothetical protein VK279_13465 [Solirubrobacteraceae bacterium]|nr:hypothetical protein [Solirubrobacteraceae bacterium]